MTTRCSTTTWPTGASTRRGPQARPRRRIAANGASRLFDACGRDARTGHADAAWGIREFNDYYPRRRAARRRRSRAIPQDLVAAALEKQVAIIGTPDDAIREIERVRQKLARLRHGAPLRQRPRALAGAMSEPRLIAEFVKPHFSEANALRGASYEATAAVINEFRQEAGAGISGRDRRAAKGEVATNSLAAAAKAGERASPIASCDWEAGGPRSGFLRHRRHLLHLTRSAG